MLTGKQFVVAINEGGVGGQNYGNNCRKQNVLATASVGLQHQQKAQGRGGGGRGLWLKRHIQWQQWSRSERLLISRNPQQQPTMRQIKSVSIAVSAQWELCWVSELRDKTRKEGRGLLELVCSAWLSFIFKHIEKQLKSKQSE